MARLLDVDILAGLGALAWAVVTLTAVPQLGELVSYEAAGAFGLLALARGYSRLRKAGS